MAQHIRTLGILHIVLSALLAIGGVIALVVMGGIAGFVGASDRSDNPGAAPILGIVGVCIFFFTLVLALPGLIGGYFLMQYKPWARILIIVLSALDLLNVPIGTALGIYGFWVLLKPETEQLFLRPPAMYTPPA